MTTPDPLVLLPGTLCDGRTFAPVVERLGRDDIHIHVLTGARTAADMARRILSVAPPRFAVCGFSLGGFVALELVAQAPERVTRLALLGTNARPDMPENAASRRAAVATAHTIGLRRFAEENLWPIYVDPARRGDAALKSVILDMAEASGIDTFADQHEIGISRVDSRPRLAAINVPALVLCGTGDQLNPPDRSEEIAAGIPDSRLVLVPATGHFPLLETPDLVAAAMTEWLA